MVIVLIACGLASRKFGSLLPGILQKNLGDVFWAAMVFFLFGFVFPQLSIWRLAILTFIFCFCIEVSKQFHVLWFDAIRATKIGRLIFGYVFGWSNLVCYFAGVALAATVDTVWIAKRLRRSKQEE
jgi:hypothetical protein